MSNGLTGTRWSAGEGKQGATYPGLAEYSGGNKPQSLHGRPAASQAGLFRLRFLNGRGHGRLITKTLLQGNEFGFSVSGGQDAVVADFLETQRQAVL